MSNGPQFFQTGYGRTYFEHQLPEQIKAMNRLAAAIEKQNELNTPKNEYAVYYNLERNGTIRKSNVYAKSFDDARELVRQQHNYEVYEVTNVQLVKLGG